jgi:hypothetical protein
MQQLNKETQTAMDRHTADSMTTSPSIRHMPLREAWLFAIYQLRLLNWWLFLFMIIGFLGSGALFWLTVRNGGPAAMSKGNELSRFVFESGAGLIAGCLTSFLIVGDTLLELQMTTRAGIGKILTWRYLLTFFILAICSAGFLTWTRLFGTTYTQHQTLLVWLFMWLAPVLVMSMLALLFSLLTRNAPLGTVMASLPLIADLLFHSDMLPVAGFRPFFIPFSIWEYDAPDWWENRLALVGISLLLAIACWLWLRREEHLLGNMR